MNTKVEHKSGPKMKMQESDELILEEPKKTETKPEDGDGRVEYYMYTCMNAGAPLMSGAPSPLQCSLELSGPPPTFCAFSLPHSLDHTLCPPASQPGPHTFSLSLSTWPISLSPTLTRLLQRHCGHHRLRR